MRATARYLACLAAVVSAGARPSESSPIYLSGYYRVYPSYTAWQSGDGLPWYVVKDAPWADARLVKWGYLPVTHNAQNYYCIIEHDPPTGSRIPLWRFACGDPATVGLLYEIGYTPVGILPP